MGWRTALTLTATVAVIGLTSVAARAADDAEWKNRALALNDITGDDPIRGEIKTLTEDPAGTKKLLAAAVPLAKGKDQPFGCNAAFILAAAALQLKDTDAAKTFHHIYLDQAAKLRSPQKLVRSYMFLRGITDVLNQKKKYDESLKVSQEFLETLERLGVSDFLKNDLLREMIRTLARQGKLDEANKMADNLIKAQPADWRNLELKALLQREAGQYEEAAKIYEGLLTKVAKDRALDKDEREAILPEIHYILSGVYVDMKRVDKATEHLQILLKAHPNDPTYNNDLGYIWADHDMNLTEAEKMIRKALEEDKKKRKKDPDATPEENKDNAAYLDSLGWVLFKQKKYEEAKPILLEAVKDKEGQHIEIFDHLGELYKVLGDKAKAVEAWKNGVKVAGSSKKEQERKAEVEKKIRDNEPASK
jgi:tetratricopeptide (TPR) repeat protein